MNLTDALAAGFDAAEQAPTFTHGAPRFESADERRLWRAVDETTRSIAFFRNYYEMARCLGARANHAAVEGADR